MVLRTLCAILLLSLCVDAAVLQKIFDEDGNGIFENLREKMDGALPDEKIPVIIVYKENTPLAGTVSARLSSFLSHNNLKHSYRSIPAVAASLTRFQVEEVCKDPWIAHIELDAITTAALETAKSSFGVQAIRSQFGFNGDADGIPGNYSKDDIVIAVADTGVSETHADLRDKILYWKDYLNGVTSPYDDHGHGTHVAGVIAGSGKANPELAGIAPEAALVAFKILNSNGNGSVSDGIAAVDETITNRDVYNIRIINLSLSVAGSSNGKDAFSIICNRAVSEGIVVVAAAGNSGPTRKTIGSPSAAKSVITVAAGADLGEKGFYLADFSSRGPTADGRIKPDLWGPGVNIRSPKKGNGYSNISGTSFAAPFVAGVVALMLDANSSLRPASIKTILTDTAVRWAPNGKSNEAGFGRLQAYQAITRAAAITSNLDPPAIPGLKFVKAGLSNGQQHSYGINITGIQFPIAVTVVILNFPSAGFGLQLVSPSGTILGEADSFRRQLTVTHKPTTAGTYTVNVKSLSGNSPYLLDISGLRTED